MRIGINLYNSNPAYKGGVNTYTFGLLDGFANTGNNHSFQLYVKESNKHIFEKYRIYKNFEIIVLRDISKIEYYTRALSLATMVNPFYRFVCDKIYSFVTEAQNSKSDLIYTPTTILFPYDYKVKTIISMHDIQQFHYPEFFSKKELVSRKVHFKLSADLTNYLQASSTFIKEDLLTHFPNLKPEQIEVIQEGVDIEFFSKTKETSHLTSKYNIPDEFLFFPAQLWLHKNHITVLKALKKLREEGITIPLVLTGAKESAADQIFSFISENNLTNVYYLGLVPFEDLLALYQKAKFLITAVLYESSSLPVLEAAASGTPVIASATPPNVEMSKVLSMNLFEPKDEVALAELLKKIWSDKQLIAEQIENNKKNIDYYSWDNVARKYLDFISRIMN